MRPLVILACGQAKQAAPAPALDLYTGPYFAATRAWALSVTSRDRIFILSAKHGLVAADRVLAPYDRRLARYMHEQLGELVERQAARLLPDDGAVTWFCGGREYLALLEGLEVRAVSDTFEAGRLSRGLGAQRSWYLGNLGRLPRWHYRAQIRDDAGGVLEVPTTAGALDDGGWRAVQEGRPLPRARVIRYVEIPPDVEARLPPLPPLEPLT